MTLLSDPASLAARRAMLDQPHMTALRGFAAGLRATHGPLPDFDPADAGVRARVLLLLETPGTRIGRTGFVSADNATGTAANLRRFLAAGELDRRHLAIWNAVPFVIHTGGPNRAPRVAEIRRGLALLSGLLELLPDLRCVVLAGRIAGTAEPLLRAIRPDLAIVRVPHPSPVYVCTNPEITRRLIAGFAEAAGYVQTENLVQRTITLAHPG